LPGYGSVARWYAIAAQDVGRDSEAICFADPIKIFETIGRDTGWITASTVFAKKEEFDPPRILLVSEILFNEEFFLTKVQNIYKDFIVIKYFLLQFSE